MSGAGKLHEPSMDDIIRSIRNIIADDAMVATKPAAKPAPKPAASAPVYKLTEQQISAPAPVSAGGVAANPAPAPVGADVDVAGPEVASADAQPATAIEEDDFDLAFAFVADDEEAADAVVPTAELAGESTPSADDVDFKSADPDPAAELEFETVDGDDGRYGANGVEPEAIRDDTVVTTGEGDAEQFATSSDEARASAGAVASIAAPLVGRGDGVPDADQELTDTAEVAEKAVSAETRTEDASVITAVASATSHALSGPAERVAAPALAAAPASGAPSSSGTRTFEESVREMLRPMIKEWLDANMPRIIERAVIEEIDKK